MPDKRISELAPAAAPVAGNLFALVQLGATKKLDAALLPSGGGGATGPGAFIAQHAWAGVTVLSGVALDHAITGSDATVSVPFAATGFLFAAVEIERTCSLVLDTAESLVPVVYLTVDTGAGPVQMLGPGVCFQFLPPPSVLTIPPARGGVTLGYAWVLDLPQGDVSFALGVRLFIGNAHFQVNNLANGSNWFLYLPYPAPALAAGVRVTESGDVRVTETGDRRTV